jgi:hypothetical protein
MNGCVFCVAPLVASTKTRRNEVPPRRCEA